MVPLAGRGERQRYKDQRGVISGAVCIWSSSGRTELDHSPSRKETDGEDDDRNDDEQVQRSTHRVPADEAEGPEDEQDDRNGRKHGTRSAYGAWCHGAVP